MRANEVIPMDQLDEYEQGERVRKWLRQNGSSLITGIALGLACVYGWQMWQGKGARHKDEAAIKYAEFGDAIVAKDTAKSRAFLDALDKSYADTPYAALAALRQAAELNSLDKPADALAVLQSALPRVMEPAMKELFQLHIARLQLTTGKAKDAEGTLKAIGTPQFPAIAGELRGDIALALGQPEQARKAYQDALTHLDEAAPTRRLVELKLIDAGGEPSAKPEI